MIQIDLPVAFTVGQIFAFVSREYLKDTPEKFTNKLLGPVNLHLSCGFAPAAIYFSVGWPSWETMYITDWVEKAFNQPIVAASYALFIVSLILLGNLSFILAHYCYEKRKDHLVIGGIIIGLIFFVLPLIRRWPIWIQIGTYAQVHSNQGYSILQNPFFGGCLIAVSYFLVSTILTCIWLRKICYIELDDDFWYDDFY